MKHVHFTDVAAEDVAQGAKDTKIRWLIAKGDNAPNFYMRHFTIAPGGSTPHHEHAWEHELFILTGAGTAVSASGESAVKPGDVIFMPGGEMHQFKNTGSEPLTFLCLVPAGD